MENTHGNVRVVWQFLYFDSAWWRANQLTGELPAQPISVCAGARRSGAMRDGAFVRCSRDTLKEAVRTGELRLLLGADAVHVARRVAEARVAELEALLRAKNC